MPIPGALRRLVAERAQHRCEYCGLAQAGQEAVFHVDHVRPLAAGGSTDERNLAFACVSCSLRKGARQRARDPETGRDDRLFDPRHDTWRDHFRWDGVRIAGITSVGRATIAALALNRSLILSIREEESLRGRHPPPAHV
ncbi:MAG: HNH endonuclease [Cyanobacteria bacterium]|nr:HNH endonuclease [Cyanobacteriota bacterium]